MEWEQSLLEKGNGKEGKSMFENGKMGNQMVMGHTLGLTERSM